MTRYDVHNVTVQQLRVWLTSELDSQSGVYCSTGYVPRVGDYVVVCMSSFDGRATNSVVFASAFPDYDSAAGYVDFSRSLDAGDCVFRQYEIWRVDMSCVDYLYTLKQLRFAGSIGYEPIQCAVCGDSHFGPWAIRRGAFGYYHLCELCLDKYESAVTTLER